MNYFQLLKQFPDFKNLYIARTISLLGDWLNVLAILALFKALHIENPVLISYLFIIKLLPNFVFGAPAGVLADRIDRKKIMLASDIIRFFLIAGIFTAPLFSSASLIIILVLLFLQISASSFFEAARSASVPNLVPKEELATANALGAVTWSLMFTLGAALGGFITQFFGWELALGIDMLSYLLSIFFVLKCNIAATQKRKKENNIKTSSFKELSGYNDVKEGLLYIINNKNIATIIMAKTGLGLAGATSLVLTLYGNVYTYSIGASFGVAVLFTSRALGTALGPVISRHYSGTNNYKMKVSIAIGFIVGAIFYILFGINHNPFIAIPLIIACHIGTSVVWVFTTVLLQMNVPDYIRGRIFAADLGLATLTISIMLFIFGNLAEIKNFEVSNLPILIGVLLLIPAGVWFSSQILMSKKES